ncbi:50S ribosomal protein L31e [Nanoarchaeota archaeon]
MADEKKKKEKEERKVVLERTYVVPLRKEWLKAPKYKRAKKAVMGLQQFIAKHMKADIVKLGKYVNKEIWKHGIQNPPHKVKIECSKDDKGIVIAELVGAPKKEKKSKAAAKKEAKAITEKSKTEIKKELDKLKEKTEEAKKEVKAEENKPEVKPVETKEEPKKEVPKESVEKKPEEKAK